jgi:hypothetical protein
VRLTAITLENFRAWGQAVKVPIKPITIVYGPNNSGKSGLVRALPLLSDSLRAGGLDSLELLGRLAPYELDLGTLWHRSAFAGRVGRLRLGLEFEDGSPLQSITWTIGEHGNSGRMTVLELVTDKGTPHATQLEHLPREDEVHSEVLTCKVNGVEKNVRFAGLRPFDLFPGGDARNLVLQQLRVPVIWLNTRRSSPARLSRVVGLGRYDLQPDGSDAAAVLLSHPPVLETVRSWLIQHAGLDLRVTRGPGNLVATELTRPEVGLWMDAIDCGEGIGQLISVLTSIAMVRHGTSEWGPPVVVIEEPESHLHKNLQRALLDEMVSSAQASGGAFVIETHSRTLLLAAQLAVSRENEPLAPESIQLVWVSNGAEGAHAEFVSLNQYGRFDGDWPPDGLREEFALAAELAHAREAREGGSP